MKENDISSDGFNSGIKIDGHSKIKPNVKRIEEQKTTVMRKEEQKAFVVEEEDKFVSPPRTRKPDATVNLN